MANVTEMPPPEVTETADTPPETAATPATPTPAPVNKGGRPRKGTPSAAEPRFFDRVAAVPKADWGARAFMYVYADEPVTNPKTFGTTRYMLKSSAPILDLEQLKQDYGSFKGWMTLNLRKTGKDQTDEVDRFDFEIYDPKHPPKIPRSAWANDPRNKKWLDLLPPEKPAPSEGAGTMLDAMKVYKEIRNEVKDEMPEPTAPADQTRSTLETMKLAKELFAQPAAAVPAVPVRDPLEIAVGLATTMMQMKADNPMVDFLREQMKQQHDEMMAMRKELSDARQAPAVPQKSFLDQLFELAADDTKFDKIKRVAGMFGLGSDGGGRTSRMTGLDLAKEIVNSPFGANLGSGLGTLLQSLSTGGQSNGGAMPNNILTPVPANGAGVQPGTTHETDQQKIGRIAATITNPMMNEYFEPGEPGDLFAELVFNAWPEDFRFLKKLGPDTIVNLYRQYNQQLWNHIVSHPTKGNREQAFREFMKAFCDYVPEGEEEEQPAADPDAVTDLEGAEA